MAYGLVRCGGGCHYFSLEYNAYVITSNWNKLNTEKYACPVCKNTNLFLITNYNPSLILEKVIVGTFGEVKNYYESVEERLKIEPDSIRKVLDENNFTLSKESSRENIIYFSPEGYKAIFKIKHKCKTQDLMLLVPPNHEIIGKIIEANKADKRKKRENTPKKSPLPTVVHDFLGDDITIGDWVAYSSMDYTDLRVGKITKLNEKNTVTILTKQGKTVSGKNLHQIIKISKERAVLLMLEM
jgi:hypothetical protein